jgi:hypothetical protein
MPYDSRFWLQRSQETFALSEEMKDAYAKLSMKKLAKKYERIALRSACEESRIAFDSAREALRVSQGTAHAEQIVSLTNALDGAKEEMQKAGSALEVFLRTHLLMFDDVDAIESYVPAASAR